MTKPRNRGNGGTAPARRSPARASAPWLDKDIRVLPVEEEWRLVISGADLPPFRPPVDDGLGWGEILVEETWALTDPGPLRGLRKALWRTLSRLRRGRVIYENTSQRKGAKIQLEAVLKFLQVFRQTGICQGDMPLRALLRGLESLDLGAVEPMLQPAKKPAGGRPVNLQSVVVRAYAAAGAELARRGGRTLPKACDLIADQLDTAGYRTTAAHGGTITGATVRAWRREARERSAADPLREIYEQQLTRGRDFASPHGRDIDNFLDELRAWAPPGEQNPPG